MTFLEAEESVLRKVAEVKAQTAGFWYEPYSTLLKIAEETDGSSSDMRAAALLDMAAAADVISCSFCERRAEKAGKGDPSAEELSSGKYPEGRIRTLSREAQKALLKERAKFLGKQFTVSFSSDSGEYSPEAGYESGRAVAEMYEWAASWFSHSGPGPYDDIPQWEREAYMKWRKARDIRLQVSTDMYTIADIVVHGKDADHLQDTESLFEKDDRTPKQKISGLKESILKSEEALKNMPCWTML